ncbi:MaoC family dehydratase N-terminal domain-containing protein [Alicyclobacillus cycloheptanicus]|uniref:Acyl dehydratase n=1 Tax=Alicyclobacillus cycloheptanicus TaxID=1457 RepID=A0ABT9XF63_9BACL|nr:MaoC family dehydratase N-terminal domain-containing protein [Alicyclobacillus cycloheptanicus]MDQ0188938.1 acyl dehydratase [Alicyclobacillus cycloheptanicus]WDM01713.1 MaoC family dehydratase N-terminal domain-containing protein [Alicyclobacillus cycloheptanicus]
MGAAERYRPFVGQKSSPVKNEVEKGAIRKFADAIGDRNPLYRDEDYAKTTRYGKIIAPPTFSRTFDFGKVPNFELPAAGLIHANQEFEYFRPIYAGDVVYCTNQLVDAFEKTGKLGTMTFLVFEQVVADEAGTPYLKQRSTIIYRGE